MQISHYLKVLAIPRLSNFLYRTHVSFEACRGMVEGWDPKVSDVLLIKGALQSESVTFLKKKTEEKYHVYRTSRMAEERQQRQV